MSQLWNSIFALKITIVRYAIEVCEKVNATSLKELDTIKGIGIEGFGI